MSTTSTVVVDVGTPKHFCAVKRISFNIHNFELLKRKTYMTSCVGCCGYQWYLLFSPWGLGFDAEWQRQTSMHLGCKKESGQPWPHVKFSISVGNNLYKRTMEQTWDIWRCTGGWNRYAMRWQLLGELDSSNTLIVHVDIQLLTEKETFWCPQETLQQKLERHYIQDKKKDVTFVISGEKIVHAHQIVLDLQSPTLSEFAKEAKNATVYLEGADGDLFETIIHFMYTNSLPSTFDLKKDGLKLLAQANKFGCIDLKMHLEAKILDEDLLTVENAAEMLMVADGNAAALLKEAAMDLLVIDPTKTMGTSGWKDLQESNQLLSEVLLGSFSKVTLKSQQPTTSDTDPEKLCVSELRKCLAEKLMDYDGTKEMLVKRLKDALKHI